MHVSNLRITVLLLLGLASVTVWGQDESITYDPVSESYIYRYRGYEIHEDGTRRDLGIMQGIYTPAKIAPRVMSRLQTGKDGIINYRYTLFNGNTAKQRINRITFFGMPSPSIVVTNQLEVLSPDGWEGLTYDGEFTWMPAGDDYEKEGLLPGYSLAGFGFASMNLPGIVQADLSGKGSSTGFDDSNSGPDETSPLSTQDDIIMHEDYKPYPVAAPMVAVPNPFDAAELVDRIRAHVATWPNFKTDGYNGNVPPDKKIFLLDTAFAAKLDGYLSSAANAYRLNNPKAAKEHIHTLRKMLAKEHHHVDNDDADDEDTEEHKRATRRSIDRLAARVLDFDLRYVLKRMERGHEKDGHGKDEHRKDDPRKR